MPRRAALLALALLVSGAAAGADDAPRRLTVFLSSGRSQPNWHGWSSFRTIGLEMSHPWPRLRTDGKVDVGLAVSYSDVRQPRSWFGHAFGDPDDRIRAENLSLLMRRSWPSGRRFAPFAEIATGPMWSNRRIPAATSRLNFDSQLAVGVKSTNPRMPVVLSYRFSHISNAGIASRNPGLNVHTFGIGTKLGRRAT